MAAHALQSIPSTTMSVSDETCFHPMTAMSGSSLCVFVQDLVGKNLTYISQLDGLTFELYSGSVLPRLLEQVRHP